MNIPFNTLYTPPVVPRSNLRLPTFTGALSGGFTASQINAANRAGGNAGVLVSPTSAAAIRGGASVISNGNFRNSDGSVNMDAGQAAQGFGIGIGSVNSPSSAAISDALRAASKNRQ